jgi:hypothetical protein
MFWLFFSSLLPPWQVVEAPIEKVTLNLLLLRGAWAHNMQFPISLFVYLLSIISL